MIKRVFSILLTLVMVFTLMPMAVFATDEGGTVPPEDGIVDLPTEPVNPIDGEDEEDPAPTVSYALLTVALKGDCSEELKGGKFVLKNSSDEVLKEWTTDEKGEFLLDYYVDGTYKLYQTEAPTHFAMGQYVEFDVIISDSGASLSLQPYNGNESPTVVGTEEAVTYNVYNTRLQGTLGISAEHAFQKNGLAVSEGDWLENVAETEYKLTVTVAPAVGAALSGVYGDAEFANNVAELTLKQGETAEVTGLPCGTKYAVTTESGDAYVASVTDGEGVISAEGGAAKATYTYFYEDHNKGFNAVWVDGMNPEAKPVGKLTVYGEEACENVIAELTPDADGKLTWSTETVGTYYLKETETPAGYHGNSDVIALTVATQTLIGGGKTEHRMVYTAANLEGTVVEEGVDEAYADKVYTVVSAPIQQITVSAQVSWVVPEGYTDIPESVDVQLYRDGAAYGNPVTLNAENNWKTSWFGVNITDNYTWKVAQVSIPEGYSEAVVHNGANVYTIQNTLNYNKVTVSASVSWLNPKDYTKQPISAKLTLYRDGEAYDTVSVNESNQWMYRWQDLPDCFEWTVDEPVVPSEYKKKITHVGNAWVIVNAHEEIPLTGDNSHVWLWAGATGVAAIGLAATLLVLLKKRKAEKNQDEE